MSEPISDARLGISLRFIREWKPESVKTRNEHDIALELALCDTREVSFPEKWRDAITFVEMRQLERLWTQSVEDVD